MTDSADSQGRRLASFSTDSKVAGAIEVPRSKSFAQRAVVAALLTRGTTHIEGLPSSEDVLYAIRAARAAGATFPSAGRPDDLLETALVGRRGFGQLIGAPPLGSSQGLRERARPWATLPVGESGTSARLFTAAMALARPEGSGAEVIPSGSLVQRQSSALMAALRGAGVGVEPTSADQPGSWPVMLTAATPPALVLLENPTSSQEVSALLMALAAHPEARRLRVVGKIPSRGYVDVTCDVLRSFGAFVSGDPFASDDPASAGENFTVQGPLVAPDLPFVIEPDASSAAVALAAGALSGGSEVVVAGLGTQSRQPDAAVVWLLTKFGCDTSGSNTQRLVLKGAPTHGANIDCGATPDAAPVLAAVGAFAALHGLGGTTLTGLETLPGKESSRIEVLAAGLRKVGLKVDHDDESLTIHDGPPAIPNTEPVVLDAAGDHRMAFAFALLSLFVENVWVSGSESVAKSWPQFWHHLTTAGAVARPSASAPFLP